MERTNSATMPAHPVANRDAFKAMLLDLYTPVNDKGGTNVGKGLYVGRTDIRGFLVGDFIR